MFLSCSCSGIPHLAVSNSTPPPSSSSPAPVKIKAEPISPPRDQLLSQHQQQSIVTSLSGPSSIIGITHSSAASLGSNLNHSHLMGSRPSSTGHLTPTPGKFLLIILQCSFDADDLHPNRIINKPLVAWRYKTQQSVHRHIASSRLRLDERAALETTKNIRRLDYIAQQQLPRSPSQPTATS